MLLIQYYPIKQVSKPFEWVNIAGLGPTTWIQPPNILKGQGSIVFHLGPTTLLKLNPDQNGGHNLLPREGRE